jgi:hypothetical protein
MASREDIQDDIAMIFDSHYADAWGVHVTLAYQLLLPKLVDWATERFGDKPV